MKGAAVSAACGEGDIVTLAVPAVAMPADALVRVEKGWTETEPILMISGLTQAVATGGAGTGGQQGCSRQGPRGDKEPSKPTHICSP